jgi:pyocin large subunit-like protein
VSRRSLNQHFRRHGAEVGARTVTHYADLADRTIAEGRRFTFRRTDVIRVGYYHRRTRCFVVVDAAANTILSLSRKRENHVRRLDSSTYDVDRAD